MEILNLTILTMGIHSSWKKVRYIRNEREWLFSFPFTHRRQQTCRYINVIEYIRRKCRKNFCPFINFRNLVIGSTKGLSFISPLLQLPLTEIELCNWIFKKFEQWIQLKLKRNKSLVLLKILCPICLHRFFRNGWYESFRPSRARCTVVRQLRCERMLLFMELCQEGVRGLLLSHS